jgi:hypothetical protein
MQNSAGSVGCNTLVYVVQRMGISRRVIGNKVLYLHEVLIIGTLFSLLFSLIGLSWFSIQDLSFSRNNRSGNEGFVRQSPHVDVYERKNNNIR